jgi:hypothetical protein
MVILLLKKKKNKNINQYLSSKRKDRHSLFFIFSLFQFNCVSISHVWSSARGRDFVFEKISWDETIQRCPYSNLWRCMQLSFKGSHRVWLRYQVRYIIHKLIVRFKFYTNDPWFLNWIEWQVLKFCISCISQTQHPDRFMLFRWLKHCIKSITILFITCI